MGRGQRKGSASRVGGKTMLGGAKGAKACESRIRKLYQGISSLLLCHVLE